MKPPHARKGKNPHAIAAVAGTFVLVAGGGVGAYLALIRAATPGPPSTGELGILGAAIACIAIVTHLAVASAVRHAGASDLRALLGHALEVDATDPQAPAVFEAEPALRDLVNMWIGEKNQSRELGDRLEAQRGEIDGLIQGMQHSAKDLERLRSDALSPVGVQLASLWNVLLERVKEAKAAPVAPAVVAPAPEPAPAPAADVRRLVARLDELETELGRLRTHVNEPTAPFVSGQPAPRARESAAAVPFLVPENDDDDAPVTELLTGDLEFEPEWGDVHAFEPSPAARPWRPVEDVIEPAAPAALPPVAPRSAPPARDRRAAPAGQPQFEDLDFPHFQGKADRDMSGRVEVTYEADTVNDAGDLPASSLLFDDEDPPPDGVFDLRAFGPSERQP